MSMPYIINTDHNRNYIRLKRNSIAIQTVKKLARSISAYSEVDEFEINFGMIILNQFSRVLRISVTEMMIVSPISSGISYTVTLEKYLHYFTISP